MVLIRKTAVLSSILLLASAACSAAQVQDEPADTDVATAASQVDSSQSDASAPTTTDETQPSSSTPTRPQQTTAAQTTPQQAAPQQTTPQQAAPQQAAPQQTTPQQATPQQTIPGQTIPGQTIPGQTIPGQTIPGQTIPQQPAPGQAVTGQTIPGQTTASPPAGAVPGANAPMAEVDATPWRFDMTQNGKQMTADAFDQWMKERGVHVATGKPATPVVQTCPTPEGDAGDLDGDNVINCLDDCPASEAGQTIGPDGCPVPVSIDLRGVTFAYDDASLSAAAKVVLDEAVEILTRHPSLKVEVAGHTDSRGDAMYNQKLSERRAKAVYDYLVESGIGEARLIGPKGFGETQPLVPNENPDGSDNPQNRSKNRRVELNIQN